VKTIITYDRPIVLSIAGFDPSGGAGLFADIKTFEQHQVLGMGIISANTIQTENSFLKVSWVGFDEMKEQMEPIFSQYKISAVKIGIVENLEVLYKLCFYIKSVQENCKIVWDPVLAASAGTVLNASLTISSCHEILKMIYLITPNVAEARVLGNNTDEIEAAFSLSEHCAVLLKGGHSSSRKGLDLLIDKRNPVEIIGSDASLQAKHGSGCILSSAIAANLALGHSLEDSCKRAKSYIENRLKSNQNLLAYHVT